MRCLRLGAAILGPTLGWSDLAIFSIFETYAILLSITYILGVQFKKSAISVIHARIARAAILYFQKITGTLKHFI